MCCKLLLSMSSILMMLTMFVIPTYSMEKMFTIQEESKIGYSIDYINTNGHRAQRIFNVRDPGANCFKVDTTEQKLVVINRIDREKLCPKQTADYKSVGNCEVVLKIAFKNVEIIDRVIITVEDINDNAPEWKMASVSLVFVENEPIGSRKSLPEAVDLDIGINGQIDYRLESKNQLVFRLVSDNGLYIENTQPLDREVTEFYNLKLIAHDNGSPTRKSELTLTIQIIDINDNAPKFTNSFFRPEKLIPENIAVNTVVLQLSATDNDKGKNGDFQFIMNPNTPSSIKNYFHVRPNGQVVIKNKIDYDKGQTSFEFKVIVHDMAMSPYRKSSEATVEIEIQDINDEYPEIVFYPLYPSDVSKDSAKVNENMDSLTQIGQLTVKDIDFKGIDKVVCEAVDSRSFDVSRYPILVVPNNDPKEFQIVTNRKFDHEIEPIIKSKIKCSDSADHVSYKNITILVTDINDNKPYCSKSIYHLSIDENKPAHSFIKPALSITDKDSGKNGQVSLRILPPENKYFHVESETQVLSSKIEFDREMKNKYFLSVVAEDNGNPPLRTTCKVYVHINDVNDNMVVMSPSLYAFHITENNKPPTKLGTILAKDADNQTIRYSIDYEYRSKFSVERYSGTISVKVKLDREVEDRHFVIVKATDGFHTASTTVTIFVEDINDNSPIFTNPAVLKEVIKVDTREAPGFLIKKITAIDKDEGNNGLVRYSIKRTSFKESIFNLDSENGDLYLAVSLHNYELIGSSVLLDIEACDCGNIRRCTMFTGLEIRWIDFDKPIDSNRDKDGYSKPFRLESIINENVLIGIICGLLFLMVIILIVFLVFKRKSFGYGGRAIRNEATRPSKQLQKQFIAYTDHTGPPDYHCSTELADFKDDGNSDRPHSRAETCAIFATNTNHHHQQHHQQQQQDQQHHHNSNNSRGIDNSGAFLQDTKSKYESLAASISGKGSLTQPIFGDINTVPLVSTYNPNDFSLRHQYQPHPHHHSRQSAAATAGITGVATSTATSTATDKPAAFYHYVPTSSNADPPPNFCCEPTAASSPKANQDNYYSKYIMDRYLKISNTDPSLCESLNSPPPEPRISNQKNESSFV